MYCAKSKLLDKVVSDKTFDNPIDCVKYIDTELIILNYLLDRIAYQLWFNNCKSINICAFQNNSDIKVWDITNKRYCDGFDF